VPDLALDKVEAIVSHKNFPVENGFMKKDFDVEKFIARQALERAREIAKERAKSAWGDGHVARGAADHA
jgi:hypothetical protein